MWSLIFFFSPRVTSSCSRIWNLPSDMTKCSCLQTKPSSMDAYAFCGCLPFLLHLGMGVCVSARCTVGAWNNLSILSLFIIQSEIPWKILNNLNNGYLLIFEVAHAISLGVAAYVSASYFRIFSCSLYSCFSKFKELALAYVKDCKHTSKCQVSDWHGQGSLGCYM